MTQLLLLIALLVITVPAVVSAQDTPARTASAEAQTYFAFQVEREARVKSGVPPRYPAALRNSRVTGEVLVQYIVDEQGAADMQTFKVLRSTHTDFSESVRRAVSSMAFYPAEVAGKRVRQLVQQPFSFAVDR